MNKKSIFLWVLQIIVAIILLQTLFFKFTGAKISVELFSILGVEPWGRYLLGIVELITGILLLIPKTVKFGSLLGIIIGFGAIMTHILFIGINFGGDISLFLLAITVFLLSIIIFLFKKLT